MAIVNMATVLYGILLFRLAAGVEPDALSSSQEVLEEPEARQCLMQKKHAVSRADSPSDLVLAQSNKLQKDDAHKNAQGERAVAEESHEQKGHNDKASHAKKSDSAKSHKKKGLEKSHSKKKRHKKSHGKKSHKKKSPGKKSGKKSHHKKSHHKKSHKKKSEKSQHVSLAQKSNASAPNLHELLPEPILALAWTLFEKEDAIAAVVENSVLVDLTYAGVKMKLRMNKADDAVRRMGEEGTWFSYDLDTLGDLKTHDKEMLNMLDVGGSYGVVSIAAYKKYPEHLRIVTVEPIPTTYFFLKWNLYLNGVPEIEKKALDQESPAAGVLAMNRGSADVDGKDLHLCFDPTSSMNSRVCDCQQGDPKCVVIPSVTMDNLAGMFGIEPIAMVKMDCEGCEFQSLPALANSQISSRVRRLAGELHIPDKNIEDLACRWDKGRLMTKCQKNPDPPPVQFEIQCDVPLAC